MYVEKNTKTLLFFSIRELSKSKNEKSIRDFIVKKNL